MGTEQLNQAIEQEILEATACNEMFWFGRAATALYIAYKTIRQNNPDVQQPEIIMPSMLCATPANVAIMVRLKPRFADIDLNTGLISFESAKKLKNNHTVAILIAHLYGNTADLEAFHQWCKNENIALIEDNAQALGGLLPNGKPVGSYGDFSVYSFNATKILESGGGALIVRSEEDAGIANHLVKQSFEVIPSDIKKELSLSYRNLHHSMVSLFRLNLVSHQKISELFLNLTEAYNGLYLSPYNNPKLSNEWLGLKSILHDRQEKAKIYTSLLSSLPLSIVSRHEQSGLCWRFTVLYPNESKLAELSESIRKDGFHVSNLYWPINHFFNPSDQCPNSEMFARKVLNFWVNSSVDIPWVQRCCESVRKNIELIT